MRKCESWIREPFLRSFTSLTFWWQYTQISALIVLYGAETKCSTIFSHFVLMFVSINVISKCIYQSVVTAQVLHFNAESDYVECISICLHSSNAEYIYIHSTNSNLYHKIMNWHIYSSTTLTLFPYFLSFLMHKVENFLHSFN